METYRGKRLKQGEIYLVTLYPVVGSEQTKTRPCIIISTDLVNDFANTITIAPLSSKLRDRPFPFHIKISNDGVIKVEQLRTIDKKRVIKKLGNVDFETKKKIKKTLALYFDL